LGKRWGWLVVAALAIVAAGAAWALFGDTGPGAARARFAIGDDKFEFDRRYLQRGREDEVVELAAFFPDFGPAARTDDVTTRTDMNERFRRTVVLELRPADPQIDPADRTSRLYLRFLGEAATNEAGGLVARAFDPTSPFAGDELHFTPPEGRPFAARCRRADAAATVPQVCVAEFRSGGVDAEIRFSAALLPEWQALTKGAKALLESGRR